MAGIKAYGQDYTEDLLTYRERGMTIREAAAEVGCSLRTAHRLLAMHKLQQEGRLVSAEEAERLRHVRGDRL